MKAPRGTVITLARRYLSGEFAGLKYDAAAYPITTGETLKMAVCRLRKKKLK